MKKTTKSIFVGVRMTPLEKRALDVLVHREQANQSETLRRLIRREVNIPNVGQQQRGNEQN